MRMLQLDRGLSLTNSVQSRYGQFFGDMFLLVAIISPLLLQGAPSVQFLAYTNLSVGSSPTAVGLGDFNKDGKMDGASGPYWIEAPDLPRKNQIYPPTAKRAEGP